MPQYPPQNPGSPFQNNNSGEPGSYSMSANFPRRPAQLPQMPSPAMLQGLSNAIGVPSQPPVTRPPLLPPPVLGPPPMQGPPAALGPLPMQVPPPALGQPPQLPPVINQMLQGINPTFSGSMTPALPPQHQQTTNVNREEQNRAAQNLRMEQGLRPLPPTPGLIQNPRR